MLSMQMQIDLWLLLPMILVLCVSTDSHALRILRIAEEFPVTLSMLQEQDLSISKVKNLS